MTNEPLQRSLRRRHPFVVCEGNDGPAIYWNGCRGLVPLWNRNWDFARNKQIMVLGRLARISMSQAAFLV